MIIITKEKIGVIGGTPGDTEMGKKRIHDINDNLKVIKKNVSPTPERTTELQVKRPEKLQKIVLKFLNELEEINNLEEVIFYCNSLSISLDLERIKSNTPLSIISPLDVYRDMADQYSVVGLLAANNKSAAGLDKVLKNQNSSIKVLSSNMISVVSFIEDSVAPEKILYDFGVEKIVEGLVDSGAEIIILGCTHFTYFKKQLKDSNPELTVIDPGLRILKKNIRNKNL